MINRYQHGLIYEKLAKEHLEQQGYKIIAQNVRFKCGEIDLVAEQGTTLVFIEVRKTSAAQWLRPEETIAPKKIIRLRKATRLYVWNYRGKAANVRVDLIGFRVDEQSKKVDLDHHEDFIDFG